VLTFDGGVVGAGQQIMFHDPDTLDIANPASFGTGVGTDAYAGPTLEGFALGDVIELGGIAAGATMDYDPATGLMQITGGTTDATLSFQPGSFAGRNSRRSRAAPVFRSPSPASPPARGSPRAAVRSWWRHSASAISC